MGPVHAVQPFRRLAPTIYVTCFSHNKHPRADAILPLTGAAGSASSMAVVVYCCVREGRNVPGIARSNYDSF